jgi:predicted ATPase
MDIAVNDYSLSDLASINVVVGKNGCGKSTLLKRLEQGLSGDLIGAKKYITPERGGVLSYQANVEQNHSTNALWLSESRRNNQFNQFREQSVVQFRRLELAIHREREAQNQVSNFQPYINRINALLDNIEIERADPSFSFTSKANGQPVLPDQISSGEAELISLGIEILMFGTEVVPGKDNYLFLDEPDVHLHPDLQGRLVKFLRDTVADRGFTVIMATHSTAILGGLIDYDGTAVSFMKAGEHGLKFEAITEVQKRVLPVFGAHPLSNIFNEAPVLLVEGDDDVRVWQQAVRSSSGSIKLYPVSCDTVSAMSTYENEVRSIVDAVYDHARAFSLRDRDGTDGELSDEAPLIRMKLSCRAAENLLLSNDVLATCGLDWQEAIRRIDTWLESNQAHTRHAEVLAFRDGGYDRKGWDLKNIRMILVAMILNSAKPWEVLVGQTLSRLSQPDAGEPAPDPDSLLAYLGDKAARHLIPEA